MSKGIGCGHWSRCRGGYSPDGSSHVRIPFDARDLTLFLLLLSSQLLQLLIGERQGALGGLGGRSFLLLLRLLEGNIPLKLADLLLKRFLLTLEPLLLRGIVVRILGCCL